MPAIMMADPGLGRGGSTDPYSQEYNREYIQDPRSQMEYRMQQEYRVQQEYRSQQEYRQEYRTQMDFRQEYRGPDGRNQEYRGPGGPPQEYRGPGGPPGPPQEYRGPGNPPGPPQDYRGPLNLPGPAQDYRGPGNPQEHEHARKMADLETLRHIISQWNANRLDLFELSLPNEELEFNGVMRFYYQAQDLASGQKVATKCIRVSSTATTKSIIETLIEKFRPDMKMLEMPEYALYEIHESGERRLGLDEKPLLVQLNWHKDDREGRFLLRRIDEASQMPQPTQEDSSFKRKLSKREKKAIKKQEKKEKKDKDGGGKDESMADKLYTELPDTSFTRSISNPEAVMRRRRQQKLEKKLQQFRSKDGGPDTGGTLKIYGDALCKDVPYKTLLLSIRDTAAMVVLEMLEKYGINKGDAGQYCLIQSNLTMPEDGGMGRVVGGGTTRECVLEDDECPLAILMNHQSVRGAITFHVRRRPMDGRRRKKKSSSIGQLDGGLPFLVELTPEGGENRVVRLQMNVTEVGSEVGGGGVELLGLLPRHCVIAHTEGVVTVTPCSPAAEVVVNQQRVVETTILQHGATLRFGRSVWRFIDPVADGGRMQPSHHGSTATLPGGNDFQAGMRNSTANYAQYPPLHRGKDAILPAVLEFREDTESAFFNALTMNLDPASVNFKLAPTYTLYMATRFRASTHYRPELVPEERAVRLTDMLNRVADKILRLLATAPGANHAPTLSFWMANSSELLHFLKSDRHITAFSLQAQDMLADAVHMAFKQLVIALQADLELVLPGLLSDRDDDVESSTAGVISVFASAMGLLRKCRVNAALTIQLFSQLFHFVNMWTFNIIVTDQNQNGYCTHKWGLRLKRRLARVEIWAEKQGLELAADCHLARIMQTAHLLQARKGTAEDIATLSSTCFKLNSQQLKALLLQYKPAENEAPISNELIDTIVRVAENTVDELTRAEGRQVRLEEDFVLQLPFLLPEDNYSCDIVRGVPGGLLEFLQPLQNAGLCAMTPQPTSSGLWTIYMDNLPPLATRSPSEMSQITINGEFDGPSPHPGSQNGHNGYPPNGSQTGYNGPTVPNGPMSNRNSQVIGPNGYPVPVPGQSGFMGPNGPIMTSNGPNTAHSNPINGPIGMGYPGKVSPQTLAEEPEIETIRLSKTNGMGLSIVAAKGVGQERLGIYIKAVVEGGAAWQDGRLAAGDQLLTVDGQSLVGITQERAAEIMMRTGPVVTLEVARQGAIFHGLGTLLSQPSPVMGRQYNTGPRRTSEKEIRPGSVNTLPGPGNRIPQSKSTPALHQSPGGDSQHNYQNQEWLHQQLPYRPPGGVRSSSIQNLAPPKPPAVGPDTDPGYYQNLVPPASRNRFGSQTSLTGGQQLRERPASAHYPRQTISPLSPGPEKPQRQFSYEGDNPRDVREIPRDVREGSKEPMRMEPNKPSQNRVRFQDPSQDLKLSRVEEEFRRRIEEYSDSDDEPNISTIKRNGMIPGLEDERRGQQSQPLPALPTSQPLPPLPISPPPLATPPLAGAARLDMLLGNGQGRARAETPTKREPIPIRKEFTTPTKRVSFNDDEVRARVSFLEQEEEEEEEEEEGSYMEEEKRRIEDEVEDEYEARATSQERSEDPNAFINEAENLLNSATHGLERLDFTSSSGHTPSVIGTQEVYRDPRQRRLQQEQERKLSAVRPTDGAKLSFKEKMRLFAAEVGENTPTEKAKISRAQREIEDEKRQESESS